METIIFHFGKKNHYAILDFRALWSLEYERPINYNFGFWIAYTVYCRNVAKENNVILRTLDRAFWQYSKEKN